MKSLSRSRATGQKGGSTAQSPLPYAFSRRDEFLRLEPEKRTTHLWEAHVFCERQLGGTRFPEEELQRNLRVLRRMMLQVAKETAKRLREDGTWKNAADPRWPRNHKGADVDHWYDSGSFPPQFLALPEDPVSWREVLSDQPEALFDEMIAWVETPAGQAGVGDEELQKLLADRETYMPGHEKAAEEPQPEYDWDANASDRQAGLEWLASKTTDGTLKSWSESLKLASTQAFLNGMASNGQTMEKLLPELINLESCGEWEALQRHLDVESPNDAAALSRLRACLPKGRQGFAHE